MSNGGTFTWRREHRIRTDEGVSFAFALATPVVRAMALIIDFTLVTTVHTIVSALVFWLGWISFDLLQGFLVIFYFALSLFYPVVAEAYWRGRTLGKWVLKIRVMDVEGLHLRKSQVLVRNLLRAVDALPLFYGVGGLFALCHPRFQRLGDVIGGTVVVHSQGRVAVDWGKLKSIDWGTNVFAAYPHVQARLRKELSGQELRVLYQAVRRRDQLDPVERVRVFELLAEGLKEKVEFPEKAVLGLSDEEYVRNCLLCFWDKA